MSIPFAHEKVMELTAEIGTRRELVKKLEAEIKELEVIRENIIVRIEELS